MLTVNVDLQSRQGNGQLGVVKQIVLNSQNNVSKTYFKVWWSKSRLKEDEYW